MHSFSSIKPVGNAGQNSLLSSWGDVVLCNSSEDENSLKVLDTKDFKVLHSFRVFEEKDEEEFLHLTQIIMKSENEVLVAKKMKIGLYSVDKGEILQYCKVDTRIHFLEITSDSFFAVEHEVHGQQGSVTDEAMPRDK